MIPKMNVTATRQSAALFPAVSHGRFAKRRHVRVGRGTQCAPTVENKRTARRGLTRPACLAFLLGFISLHSPFCLSVFAQSYSIDWYKVSGGGGASTNGQYAVSGTIGQHDASGPMTGGNYSLTGGFWSLISVVQTPGAPVLNISRSGNTVTVYWQDTSGWSLQQNNNLSLLGNWSASGSPTLTGGTNYLNVVSPSGNLFYRLAHP